MTLQKYLTSSTSRFITWRSQFSLQTTSSAIDPLRPEMCTTHSSSLISTVTSTIIIIWDSIRWRLKTADGTQHRNPKIMFSSTSRLVQFGMQQGTLGRRTSPWMEAWHIRWWRISCSLEHTSSWIMSRWSTPEVPIKSWTYSQTSVGSLNSSIWLWPLQYATSTRSSWWENLFWIYTRQERDHMRQNYRKCTLKMKVNKPSRDLRPKL